MSNHDAGVATKIVT